MRCVHYVGFKDDRYLNAYRVFGGPAFIHRRWDKRAQREIGEDDIIVFANGTSEQQPSHINGNDLDESIPKE